MLNAIRGNSVQRSTDESSTGGIIPNGVIKTGSQGVMETTTTQNLPNTAPTRRLTRFSSLLRASPDLTSYPADPDPMATLTSAEVTTAHHHSTDHRALLMEVLCCCCPCCDAGDGGNYDSRPGDEAGTRRRFHRDGGGSGSGSSERRGDYGNLIENHRLARLVTLVAVLAIIGLVLTYIIKSIIEQQQQQQVQVPPNTTPHPIGRNVSQ